MSYISLHGLLYGLLYLFSGIGFLVMFTWLYVWWTPHNEFTLVREERKVAPALALGGAMLGFTFPMLTMMTYSVNWFDFVVWSFVAMGVQLGLEWFLRLFYPNQIQSDNCGVGTLFLASSVAVGLVNAFAFIPR